MKTRLFLFAFLLVLLPSCCNRVSILQQDGYNIVYQTRGPELGYSPSSGVEILFENGLAFKDLDKDGEIDPYEDWRLGVEQRAADLASKMSLEQICGLMLYSSAVKVDSAAPAPKHIQYIRDEHIRHMLVAAVKDAPTCAAWSNALQALCEADSLGIPSNNSTDPRNYTNGSANVNNYKPEPDGEFNPAEGSDISKWPREMGLGATFDMDLIRKHGEVVSKEYRAMGLTTALSPQADMASDPRWRRFYGTFSEDPYELRDIVREYCDAMQTSPRSKNGWGSESVNCMVKHWPGGGTGEGGRDAHFGIGKYAVYPGNNFEQNMVPFTQGAFRLKGGTKMASAVMPYYTISYGQDPSGENVANGFSKYILSDLLRGKYSYDGVICTDWGIVGDYKYPWKHNGKPWGVEELSPAQRRLLCFEVGVDQLGGAAESEISIEAYHLWEEKYGKQSARERFELSARRLLVNIFRVGLFENPYVDAVKAGKIVGCPEFVSAGYDAQLKSIVMLKNSASCLPALNDGGRRLKVYEPLRHCPPGVSHWQKPTPEYDEYPISKALLEKYYDVADTPQEADFAIVSIGSPVGHWGYMVSEDITKEGYYCPVSLQWGPYTATTARVHSIAGGDPLERSDNRSYRGRTEITTNEPDMSLVRDTKAAMGDKPVVVYVATERPFVPAEIEPWADALLIGFGVSNNAVMDIISGAAEPYAMLPCQMPADMSTVEEQCEDLPHDMRCYRDADGNVYDFAFGLDWDGRIMDKRYRKYARVAGNSGNK